MGKKKVLNALAWKFSERILAQMVNLAISILLARLLSPSDYGQVSIVMIFISIADILVNYSLSNALIQKKDADNLDFSSVFYFNSVFSVLIYMILYFCAPGISSFFGYDGLTLVVRVLALRVIIVALNSVQQAYVSKHMMFRKFFFSTLAGTILAACTGGYLAFCGFGIWALAAQYLVNPFVDTVVLWFTVKWRPVAKFSRYRLMGLVDFGWKLLLSGVMDRVYIELKSIIIGKFYSSVDLAYYKNGQQYPQVIINNINTSISSVFFPALSNEQENKEKVKNMLRAAVRMGAYVLFPCMIGLAVVADNLIEIVLTDKWLPCVPYLRVACFTYALYPIHTANLDAMKAMGRTDIMLKLEIVKKMIGVILLMAVLRHGVFMIAFIGIIQAVISIFLNSAPNKKLMGYGYWEQLKDILPSILRGGIMGLIVWGVGLLQMSAIVEIILQILAGILSYCILSALTGAIEFTSLLKILVPGGKRE